MSYEDSLEISRRSKIRKLTGSSSDIIQDSLSVLPSVSSNSKKESAGTSPGAEEEGKHDQCFEYIKAVSQFIGFF